MTSDRSMPNDRNSSVFFLPIALGILARNRLPSMATKYGRSVIKPNSNDVIGSLQGFSSGSVNFSFGIIGNDHTM